MRVSRFVAISAAVVNSDACSRRASATYPDTVWSSKGGTSIRGVPSGMWTATASARSGTSGRVTWEDRRRGRRRAKRAIGWQRAGHIAPRADVLRQAQQNSDTTYVVSGLAAYGLGLVEVLITRAR